MKTKLIFSLILATLVLAACGGQPTQAEPQPIVIPTLTVGTPLEAPALTEAPTEAATEAPVAEAPAAGAVSFATDIAPIFAGSCNNCHGGDQTKAALNLTSYEGVMAGSFNGTVIVAGNAAESVLVQQVASGEMPKRGDKLTPEQVQLISDWVAAGALNN